MTDATYDAVVLGANPAGLLAAALLARRRLRVLVVEDQPKRPEEARAGGIFRRIPYLFGCGAHQALDEVFTDIGVPLIAKKSIRPLPFPYQVILPGRASICTPTTRCSREASGVRALNRCAGLRRAGSDREGTLSCSPRGCIPQGLRRWTFRRSLLSTPTSPSQSRRITDLMDTASIRAWPFPTRAIAGSATNGRSISAGKRLSLTSSAAGHTCHGGEAVPGMIRGRITALHGSSGWRTGALRPLISRGRKIEISPSATSASGRRGDLQPPRALMQWLPDSFFAPVRGRLQASLPRRVICASTSPSTPRRSPSAWAIR
jgi:hypothetical protein